MRQSVIVFWCVLFVTLLASVTSLYIPLYTHNQAGNLYRRTGRSDRRYDRKSSRRSNRGVWMFRQFMTRHSPRFRSDQDFVNYMFHIMDLDSDQAIEKDELKAFLQLLGVVRHR